MTSFFNDPQKVEEYINMAKGYDGKLLIDRLQNYLSPGSSVLELGMGPGVDLDILAATYKVTGSDASKVFLNRYRENHPNADLLQLDAITLETDRKFECIYSNKVLHQFSREVLQQSFIRQAKILMPTGIVLHSFWYGNKEEFFEDLRFVYYEPKHIISLVSDSFEILEIKPYTEMEEEDSFYIILKAST